MPAATSIAASSAAISAAAAARARKAECIAVTDGYNPTAASVQEMREYADCVQYLHPAPLSPESAIVLKVLFVLCLLGGIWGAFLTDGLERIIAFAAGFFATGVALVAITALLCGIAWVIGG